MLGTGAGSDRLTHHALAPADQAASSGGRLAAGPGAAVRLLLVGDVMLGRLVNRALEHRPASSPWGDTLPLFKAANWRFCNLECVVSDVTPRRLAAKRFHFRSDRKNLAVLQAAGIDVVSVANNHSLDFGAEALKDMLAALDDAGIGHAGAGSTLEAAMRPALSRPGGVRVAVLACTDNEPSWAAGPQRPGVWFVPVDPADARFLALLDQTRQVRREVDLLIISWHWGSNWGRTPETGHREQARALARAGADLIFGHSSHVFRGVEVIGTSLVVYGAGNFVDDYAIDPEERNDEAFAFAVESQAGRLARLVAFPTVLQDMAASVAPGERAARMLARLQRLCASLGAHLEIDGLEGTIEVPEAAPPPGPTGASPARRRHAMAPAAPARAPEEG